MANYIKDFIMVTVVMILSAEKRSVVFQQAVQIITVYHIVYILPTLAMCLKLEEDL